MAVLKMFFAGKQEIEEYLKTVFLVDEEWKSSKEEKVQQNCAKRTQLSQIEAGGEKITGCGR